MSSGERAAFAGQITDLPVSELLRTVVHGKQTGLARFQTNLGSATLWFREGTIVDADMGRFHMGAAVRRLLTADTGTFEIEFKPISRRRLIKEETQTLLDAHAPPGLEGAADPMSQSQDLSRSGPRRARPAPGWTPTAGGKGATREGEEVSGEHEIPRRKTEARFPDPRERIEQLGRARKPSDSALHAAAPQQVSEDEDEHLTRVAKVPELAHDVPTARAAPELPTFPQSWADASDDDVTRPPAPSIVAPPVLELDRSAAAAESVAAEPSASATAMGHTSHATEPAPSERPRTPALASLSAPPRRTRMGIPQMVAPSSAPAEPRRIKGTDKMPVQEPGSRGRANAEPEPSDGTPVAIDREDLSDPIPIGTTWDAPSHLATPEQAAAAAAAAAAKVESSNTTHRSGEIRRRGAADRTVVPFAPQLPFQKTKPEPGATVTDGFRPIVAPGTKPITDSYPTVEPGESSRRATAIAATIGLDPSASGVEEFPRAPTAAPAVVGRYEVLLRIARGGMGTVYLCRVTGAGGFRRLFALKVIRDHLSRNAEYVTMLLQEARIASRLHHPNVVGIVDIGTLANQHYLVMDYVEGCTFSELLKVHRKSRPPQLVIPIVLDALTGLHAAHTLVNDDGSPLTLVHCDFSPQNMLVGTNGICRITDFGIARASNALPEKSNITRGKPAYLAPEQVVGGPFDHRADVFAAGVVLWNALTGEQLFGGETPEETLEMVLHRPIQPPSQVGLRPPRSLDRVVMRALQRDPDARYQTAEQMLIDLRRVAITEDLLAPASEVSRWVAETFGTQLELRRQAAGIVAKPGPASNPRDSREISVPELGLGPDASATHSILHAGVADDADTRTVMLHTGLDPALLDAGRPLLNRRERNLVFGIAAAMAGIAIALAFMRPGWLLGGFLDEDGTYFEPDPPIELPEVVEALPPPTKTPETKTPDAKGDTTAPETKTEPGETKVVEDAKVDAPGEVEPGEASMGETKLGEAPKPEPEIEPEPPPEPPPEPKPEIDPTPPPPKPTPAKSAKTKPPKPRPEPKEEPTEPEPKPEPKPEPEPEEPAEETPPPPPPKKSPEEPTLPKPPDLKELLDG